MALLRPKGRLELQTAAVGARSEMFIVQRLIACGYTVLAPIGSGNRYDLVIEDADGNFWRIQCKTARRHKKNNAIEFNTYNVQAQNGKKRGYAGVGIHYFAAFWPEEQRVFLMPFDEVTEVRGYLRLGPRSQDHPERTLRMAEDYEI